MGHCGSRNSRFPPAAGPDIDRTRRNLLLGLGGLAAAAAGCGGDDDTALTAERPNVLLVFVDDLNDWVGFLGGHPQVRTPNMDRLAARSTVFRRAYCNAPVCNPSRASALTGLSVQETKVFDNNTSLERANPGAIELPRYLATKGYEVRLAGKISHVYAQLNQPLPDPHPFHNRTCPPPIGPGAFDWAPLDMDDQAMPDYAIAEDAIEFLAQPHARSFFLGVGFIRTHLAWYVPRSYFDLYSESEVVIPFVPPDDLEDLPPAGRETALKFDFHNCITSQGLWASAVRGYLASISFVDAQIGRVLDALERGPYADNTVVTLVSDHGFHLGEKFHWHKQALWERATRIPFVINRPGQRSSSVVQSPVSLIDLVPTVLDLCGGISAPYPLSGRSLRPLLDDPSSAWDYPVLTTKDQHDHAIRTEEWRYIRYANGDRELYDESADPEEWNNLAGASGYEDVTARLDAMMPPPPA